MCLGLFDSVKVYQHSCNAFDDKNAFSFDAAKRAQAKLERYLHYSTRYDNHAKVCHHLHPHALLTIHSHEYVRGGARCSAYSLRLHCCPAEQRNRVQIDGYDEAEDNRAW
jgi:hypothetical protein